MEYKPGDRLCSCTLVEKCGTGAYGDVWLAEDSIGTRVALKIIVNRGSYSERELAGLKNYKDCNHPNLLKIRYVEITDERICCIMDAADDLNRGQGEYLPDTLANRLNKFGRLDGKEIIAMLDGLLAGLEELHKNGLVHRDIKPDNILWVNGRPTIADAGLIAQDGKGSLVGTPGFMSPKLMAGKGPADASDDFYALGKVIYCALTGLPVGEYPSIPQNMTISMDASLGRAFRESCKHPVRSSAEFRKLLEKKNVPAPGPKKQVFKIWFTTSIVILLLSAVISIFLMKNGGRRLPTNELPPDSKEAAEIDRQLKEAKAKLDKNLKNAREERDTYIRSWKNLDTDAQKDLQNRVSVLFHKVDFLPGDGTMTPVLLDYKIMTLKEIHHRLWNTIGNPRLAPNVPEVYYPPQKGTKTLSLVESELFTIIEVAIGYPDFDPKQVKNRQDFWRSQSGSPAEIQTKMLESDPLMQAVALDAVIRQGINSILQKGKMSELEMEEMKELLRLRRELLDPGWSRLMFMGKKFDRK